MALGVYQPKVMLNLDSIFFCPLDSAEEEKGDAPKPNVLWSLCFQHRDLSSVTQSERMPTNTFVVTGPGMELDTDRCVEEVSGGDDSESGNRYS